MRTIETFIILTKCFIGVLAALFNGIQSTLINMLSPIIALFGTLHMKRRLCRKWDREGEIKVIGRFVRFQTYRQHKATLSDAHEFIVDFKQQQQREAQKRAFGIST